VDLKRALKKTYWLHFAGRLAENVKQQHSTCSLMYFSKKNPLNFTVGKPVDFS